MQLLQPYAATWSCTWDQGRVLGFCLHFPDTPPLGRFPTLDLTHLLSEIKSVFLSLTGCHLLGALFQTPLVLGLVPQRFWFCGLSLDPDQCMSQEFYYGKFQTQSKVNPMFPSYLIGVNLWPVLFHHFFHRPPNFWPLEASVMSLKDIQVGAPLAFTQLLDGRIQSTLGRGTQEMSEQVGLPAEASSRQKLLVQKLGGAGDSLTLVAPPW